ncbi:MAG: hypothetical protein L6Q66_11250 [Bacteroidia bacterium]|nr:hypothetical protein [Bacteroidia bacterium]
MGEKLTIRQGNTIEVECTLTDAAGDPVPPSTLEDYEICVYSYLLDKKLVKVFKKTPGTGQGQVIVVDDTTAKVKAIINPSVTKTLKGDIYIEVAVKRSVGVEYENSEFSDGETHLYICTMAEKANKTGL